MVRVQVTLALHLGPQVLRALMLRRCSPGMASLDTGSKVASRCSMANHKVHREPHLGLQQELEECRSSSSSSSNTGHLER